MILEFEGQARVLHPSHTIQSPAEIRQGHKTLREVVHQLEYFLISRRFFYVEMINYTLGFSKLIACYFCQSSLTM